MPVTAETWAAMVAHAWLETSQTRFLGVGGTP